MAEQLGLNALIGVVANAVKDSSFGVSVDRYGMREAVFDMTDPSRWAMACKDRNGREFTIRVEEMHNVTV